MKHLVAVLILGLGLAGTLAAQTDYRQAVKDLGLTDDLIAQVVQVVKAAQPELDRARADVRISQAQLDRVLLDENPGAADIEKQVRAGLDREFQVTMVKIGRDLKVRQLIGQSRWSALASISRSVQDTIRLGKKPTLVRSDDKPPLRDLMPLLDDLD